MIQMISLRLPLYLRGFIARAPPYCLDRQRVDSGAGEAKSGSQSELRKGNAITRQKAESLL